MVSRGSLDCVIGVERVVVLRIDNELDRIEVCFGVDANGGCYFQN